MANRNEGRCLPRDRFYFFSNENRASHEAPHIHVASGNCRATFWLEPVSVRAVFAYTPREVERIRRIVVANRGLLLRRWHEFFDEGT